MTSKCPLEIRTGKLLYSRVSAFQQKCHKSKKWSSHHSGLANNTPRNLLFCTEKHSYSTSDKACVTEYLASHNT